MKITNVALGSLLIAVICCSIYFILPAYTKYREHKRSLQKIEQEVRRRQEEKKALRRDVHALRNNPGAVERVAREKFGWCREGEKIYHFEDIESRQ